MRCIPLMGTRFTRGGSRLQDINITGREIYTWCNLLRLSWPTHILLYVLCLPREFYKLRCLQREMTQPTLTGPPARTWSTTLTSLSAPIRVLGSAGPPQGVRRATGRVWYAKALATM